MGGGVSVDGIRRRVSDPVPLFQRFFVIWLASSVSMLPVGTQVGKLVTRLWMGWGNSGAWIGDHVLEYGHRCGCIDASIGLGMCRH